MKRSLTATMLAAVLWSSQATAAVTVTIEGAFTQQRQSTQIVGPPEVLEHEVIDVQIPFSVSFDLSVDPNAPVRGTSFPFTGEGRQTHAVTRTVTADYIAPDPLVQSSWTRLQDYSNRTLDETTYLDRGGMESVYSRSIVSERAVTDNASYTRWSFSVINNWQGGEDYEFWRAGLVVNLTRPASYTVAETAEPMSHADLVSFLDGFHEAGGTIQVVATSAWTHPTGDPRFDDNARIELNGDFQLVSAVQAPIPEPSTVALLVAGGVFVAWRVRRVRSSRP